MQNNYVVIMAGGIGSRFWPYSRTSQPKQFLDILGTGKTLIQSTYERFKNICPPENVLVVTNEIYIETVKEQLPQIPPENILAEPMRRNTAPCIAFANRYIAQKNDKANIIVSPADHLIIDTALFEETMKDAIAFVENKDALLTLGISPNRPETGYGYIQAGKPVQDNIFKVKTFTEKPNKELAQSFLESGDFSWNSGIFVWTLDSINKAFQEFQPQIYDAFEQLNHLGDQNTITPVFSSCPSISIDYAIMEHAQNVYVKQANFDWSDLGTWSALYDNSEKDQNNIVSNTKDFLAYNTENTIIKSTGDKFIVLEGLKDFIFVETDDVIMVCRKSEEQNIKQFVNDIKEIKGESIL